MMTQANPFALAKASDITDQQINDLWVELGSVAIRSIIDPSSNRSKFILGGKGTGKTHILRYYSYPAVKLRAKRSVGLNVVLESKFLAVFVRAVGMDSARFEVSGVGVSQWQQLFGVYFELRLVEAVLDALIDVVASSPAEVFQHREFIGELQNYLAGADISECVTITDLRKWVLLQKRLIDDAINNSAFSGVLDVRIPFSLGHFSIPIAHLLGTFNKKLKDIPLIYLVDEIENFSESQQEVVNTLIRYGEGQATFRITGRLYSRKTLATIGGGEENREFAEHKTEILDDLLRKYPKYPEFSAKFVQRRLALAGVTGRVNTEQFNPRLCFENIDSDAFYSSSIEQLGVEDGLKASVGTFANALRAFVKNDENDAIVQGVTKRLVDQFPLLIAKLNIVLFTKKLSRGSNLLNLADKVSLAARGFVDSCGQEKGWYSTAYGHYSTDLFAQICRDSKRLHSALYAGFDMFIRMSWGNPRNLLIILGRAYEIAQFRNLDFINGQPLSVHLQTEAALSAARFTLEEDSNHGRQSDVAREAARRLAEYLRAARFSLRIPEKSPLTISFSESDLSPATREVLNSALKFTFMYEVDIGRTDRNTKTRNKKIQLNPILSPRWGLPVVRGGDMSLNREILEAIFAEGSNDKFEALMRASIAKWNSLIPPQKTDINQKVLFAE